MSVTVAVSPRQLSWNDFLPVDSLPDDSGDDAQTATEMPGLDNIRPVLGQGRFMLPSLTLTVGLDRSQTMVLKTANKTPELLKHERGHFDITVLTVRALAKEMEQMQAGSVDALGKILTSARRKHQQRANLLEKKYDGETGNSRNADAQKTWNNAIDAAMKGSGIATLQGMLL